MIVVVAMLVVGLAGTCLGVFMGFCLYYSAAWMIRRVAINGLEPRS